MKSLLPFVILLLSVHCAWAQDAEISEKEEIDTLQMYIQNAQYQKAVDYLNLLEPSKDLLYQKGLCYKYLNDYSGAIDIFKTLSEEYPDDIPVQLQLALCYEALSHYMKSVDCYENLLRIDSTNTYFEVRRADLFYRAEKYTQALDAYSRIDSTYNPNYTIRSIAMCYEKMNQPDVAEKCYKEAWELNPRDAYSAISLVKIQVQREDYPSAFQTSEQFIETDSTNTTMNALNAFVYYSMNEYAEAINRFKKCLAQGDSSLIVNRSLGFSYFLTKQDSLALPFLRKATLQEPENTNLLYVLGKVNSQLGYYPESINCFRKVFEKVVPADVLLFNLYKELAIAQEKNGEFAPALGSYNGALKYASDNTTKMELNYAMAVLADEKLKDYRSAVFFYKQYRTCLFNYQTALQDEKEIKEIEEIEVKLTVLDVHIQFLTEEIKKTETK